MTRQGAAVKLRRVEENAKRDFDQRFWWRPGHLLPDRAPDLEKAVGG